MIARSLFALLNHPKKQGNKKENNPSASASEQKRKNLQLFTKAITSKRLTEGKEILIPCCGDGEICRLYADHQPKLVVGTEENPIFRKNHKAIEKEYPSLPLLFLNASATDLPYPDASFDVVILDGALEYASNPGAMLKEAHRLLREGGVLCLSVLPAHAPHAAGTDLISLPYATMLFSEKTRTSYIAAQCKKQTSGEALRAELLVTDENGETHLRTESRLTIALLRALLTRLPRMKTVATITVPTASGLKLFTRMGGICEICTKRLLIVSEKQAKQTQDKPS